MALFLNSEFMSKIGGRKVSFIGFVDGLVDVSQKHFPFSAKSWSRIWELIVIDDLLSALVGIEGRYASIKRVRGKDANFAFQLDASMDLALQISALNFLYWFFGLNYLLLYILLLC
ncbi:hypothetical protein HYC85_008874 [Camellia sinensis]|uniref:Uncharacterized protein n=1 Tax=Camellia sinensis TaxID=4442 RepID=A0A7J7HVP1_CAMSI|nr:hypothetical protein HYC85_008874 [Camellia sinensis]